MNSLFLLLHDDHDMVVVAETPFHALQLYLDQDILPIEVDHQPKLDTENLDFDDDEREIRIFEIKAETHMPGALGWYDASQSGVMELQGVAR